MSGVRHGRSAEWERVILYRLSGQRIEEITFFDVDVRALDDLLIDPSSVCAVQRRRSSHRCTSSATSSLG